MNSHRQELWFEIPDRRGFVNITREVEAVLRESGIREGLCLVNAMHITASVFINDDEPGLHADYKRVARGARTLTTRPDRYAPQPHRRGQRRRPSQASDHGPRGRRVAITEGQLDFGPWEQIFYGEFDGRRKKRVLVKVIGE